MFDHAALSRLGRTAALRYFAETAEKGSFRAAAETLHIAASAINRQVSNLEEDLGVKLFERARGRAGLQLTEAGRILQFRLRSAVNELRIATDEIVALQGLQRGHAALGVNGGLTSNFISRAVRDFHELHPAITYLIKVDNTRGLVSRLREGEIDFAVGYNFPADADLEFMGKVSLKMFLITEPGHPLSRRKRIRVEHLGGLDVILPDSSLLLRHTFDLILQKADVQVNPIVETNSFELIYSLVEVGTGVSIVTGKAESSGHTNVEYIEVDNAVLSSNVLACCRLRGRSMSAAASAFAMSICDILNRVGNSKGVLEKV